MIVSNGIIKNQESDGILAYLKHVMTVSLLLQKNIIIFFIKRNKRKYFDIWSNISQQI